MRLYAFRSKDQISIGNCRCKSGSCQGLNRAVELECLFFFFAEIGCVWPKQPKTVRLYRGRSEGLAEPHICITQHPGVHPGFDAVCLNHWVL